MPPAGQMQSEANAHRGAWRSSDPASPTKTTRNGTVTALDVFESRIKVWTLAFARELAPGEDSGIARLTAWRIEATPDSPNTCSDLYLHFSDSPRMFTANTEPSGAGDAASYPAGSLRVEMEGCRPHLMTRVNPVCGEPGFPWTVAGWGSHRHDGLNAIQREPVAADPALLGEIIKPPSERLKLFGQKTRLELA
jgi:hypothetical protein